MQKIKVWDLATRLFHWALVIAFALSCYSAFQDKIMTGFDTMHRQAGIMVLILVVFRILWGLVGSDTARFSRFVKGPKAILNTLRGESSDSPPESVGHNPIGAVSVMVMLLLLLAQAALGLVSTDGMLFSGPLTDLVPNAERLTLFHRLLGYSLMGLVGVHVLAIVFYKLVKKKFLLPVMITGYQESSAEQPQIRSQWLALILFFISGAAVCLSVFVWLAG